MTTMAEYQEAQRLLNIVPSQRRMLKSLRLGYIGSGTSSRIQEIPQTDNMGFPSIVIDQAIAQAIGPLTVEYQRNAKRLKMLIPDWEEGK